MPARPHLAMTIQEQPEEPWVDLPDAAALRDWDRDSEIAFNQMSRQAEKARFFQRAFDFLTDNRITGDYYEFGCHRCRTFRMALTEARRHNLENICFLAFDSFEGLPEPTSQTSVELWRRGALTTSEEEFLRLVRAHGLFLDRIRTVKGFYQQTLTADLRRRFLEEGRKVSLATIDCDLYESALPVFDFIDPLLQEGSVIYIDDMFAGHRGNPMKGVSRAFLEYQQRTRWCFIRHLDVGWWGRSYITYLEPDPLPGVL